jgi:proton-translocating NADH-quinone oxidoreductase chain N
MLILLATLSVPATILPLAGAVWARVRNISGTVTLLALAASLFELPFILLNGPHGIWYYPSGLISVDAISFFFSVTVVIVSTMTVLGSDGLMKRDENSPIYYSLILFTTIGMVLVSSTSDLLFLLISWELMTVPTFALVAFKRRDRKSSEAAMKYFLAAALSASLILFGLSLAYGLTGSTSLATIIHAFSSSAAGDPAIYLLTASLLASGFAVKMALVPFHFWLPDALQGAYPQVSALLAAGSKKAGFAAALRVFVALLVVSRFVPFPISWQTSLGIVAALTITWGNVAALTQKSLSRMLAYSSIAQAGYIMVGLAVQGTAGAQFGLIGILMHVLFHGVMKGSAFVSLYSTGDSMDGISGLYKKSPGTAIGLTISLLSLAGLPPLNGFWSKLFLFMGAVQGSMPWLAAVALANSAVALGYYSYLAKRIYFEEPVPSEGKEKREVLLVLTFSSVFIIVTGLYPGLVINGILSAFRFG